jgi:YesN/AraC family two-component response regulator
MQRDVLTDGNGRVRTLIVDDSPGFREELRVLLEFEQLEVVGEGANGWEAVELTERLAPEVVLMDQNMPALSGIDATRRIKAARPATRVIFLAAEEAWREEALRSGAEAYLVKGTDMMNMIAVIKDPRNSGRFRERRPGRRSFLQRIAKLILPFLGSLLGIALLSALDQLPAVVVPAVALVVGAASALYGLR